MLKKTITYTDFNGDEQTEDFYFNLSKSELIEMELSGDDNSFQKSMQKIIESKNGRVIMQEFKKLLFKAYGERSADGKRFLKSDDISHNFEGTGAYDVLFTELVTDADAASTWVRGVMPEIPSDGDITAAKTARERSEASLQGHKPKQVPEIPTAAPTLEDDKAARRRALEQQLAELGDAD